MKPNATVVILLDLVSVPCQLRKAEDDRITNLPIFPLNVSNKLSSICVAFVIVDDWRPSMTPSSTTGRLNGLGPYVAPLVL